MKKHKQTTTASKESAEVKSVKFQNPRESAIQTTGYKKTKIGWIPEDWRYPRIKEIAKVLTGSTPPTNNENNYGDEHLFVSPADLGQSKYINRTEKMLSPIGLSLSRKIPAGSTLFTCIGSTIGKVGIAGLDLATNQQINSVIPKNEYDNEYVFYSLLNIAKRVKIIAGEQAVPIVNKSTFESFRIPLPPLSEQRKIAQILSTWDKAIELTEKLIAAKERRKRGLLQQLLTGKKRFQEFVEKRESQTTRIGRIPCDWQVKRIEEVGQIDKEILSSNTPGDYSFKYISLSDIEKGNIINSLKRYRFSNAPSRARKVVSKGDIIMATVRPNLQAFFCVRNHVSDLIVSTGFAVITPNDHCSSDFIYQSLYGKVVSSQIHALVAGSNYPAMTTNDVRKLRIAVPLIHEQKRIAAVLQAADQEIELLKKKVELLKQQKKGLMQKLLTGQVRVKLTEKE